MSEIDPDGQRLLACARTTSVAVSMFDMDGHIIMESPAAHQLRLDFPQWGETADLLETRFDTSLRWKDILRGAEADEEVRFGHTISNGDKIKSLSVTSRLNRDPVTGKPCLQITEEDVTEQAKLTAELSTLNAELEKRVKKRSQELAKTNERLEKEIAERKQVQKEIEQERNFLRHTIESLPVPFFQKDTDGRYLGGNSKWEEFLDIPMEKIIGRSAEDVLTVLETPIGLVESEAEIVRTGKTLTIPRKVQTHDGRIRDIVSHLAPFETKDGETAVIGSIVDITDQKRNENELRNRELILQEASQVTKTGFLVYNVETRNIEFISQSVQSLIGASDEHIDEMKGSMDKRFEKVGKALGQDVAKKVAEAERLGEPFEITYDVDKGGENQRTLRVKSYPLPTSEEGGAEKRVSFIQDISDMVAIEQQLRQSQKMEIIGQLTGGIAHDFNNLLAVIQGNTELLALREEYRPSLVNEIMVACNRGAELNHSLLAYARKQALSAEASNLAALCKGMESILRRTLGEAISISVKYDPELWLAHADPGQVQDAILNLAVNARDAMPNGGNISIELENCTLSEPINAISPEDSLSGEFVVLSFTDTGIGMPSDVVAKAVDPFFTTKPVGHGSGLGLSMVYGFARQSGGNVTIYSELNVGTTVKLYLPRDKADAQAATEIDEPKIIEQGNGEHIVVVEDDPAVARIVERLLKDIGYKTTVFDIAQHALDYFRSGQSADLLLTDIVLPGGMRGTELAHYIREEYPEVPILFMSGFPQEAAKKNGFIGSGSVLLNKPIKLYDFAAAVKKELKSQALK